MGWKKEVAAYFHFTRRDRVAILVLVVMILVVWLAPRLIPASGYLPGETADTSWIVAVRKLERKNSTDKGNVYDPPARDVPDLRTPGKMGYPSRGKLFYFDPNKASGDEWQNLGLRPKTIATILNFRSKGGRFRRAEDLRKIYGLFPDEYDRIAPYVRIAEEMQLKTEPSFIPSKTTLSKSSRVSIVDINLADTSAFIALPGIGSKLASRIISFREKLGGFYKIEQVAETFGLADSVYQKIKTYLVVEKVLLRKININTATIEELKAHPYIRYQLGNPIIAYRKDHGDFRQLEDLLKIMTITQEVYQHLLPYLSL